jgi:3-phenylpropionate/cinnamic acid dioxygenase small subunit
MDNDQIAAAKDLVIREGWLLDQRKWDEWLSLYLENAEYWIPCWKDEDTLTDDPLKEVSLIYYSSRAGLEDRIFRIRTKRSLASMPLPRTSHIVQPVVATSEGNEIRVESNWAAYSYKNDEVQVYFGQQTHVLRKTPDGLRIAKRKIILANDVIPNVLDIYSV